MHEQLILQNPVAGLSHEHTNKLMNQIDENFTGNDQQHFVCHFYRYLNCPKQTTAFTIDLDDIWQWLGVAEKADVQKMLETNFVANKDYRIETPAFSLWRLLGFTSSSEDKVLLTVRCFKLLHTKLQTAKSIETCNDYNKLDKLFRAIMEEAYKNQSEQQLKYKQELNLDNVSDKQLFIAEMMKTTQLLDYRVNLQTEVCEHCDRHFRDTEALCKHQQDCSKTTQVRVVA